MTTKREVKIKVYIELELDLNDYAEFSERWTSNYRDDLIEYTAITKAVAILPASTEELVMELPS